MARLRSEGKASDTSAEPNSTTQLRKRGRKSNALKASVPEPSVEAETIVSAKNTRQQSSAQPISEDQPSSSTRNRITRSNRRDSPLARLPTPTPKKRRSTIAVTQEKSTKRPRNSTHNDGNESTIEAEPPRSNQDDEHVAQESDQFFNGINANILTNLRPGSSAKNSAEREGRAVVEVALPKEVDANHNNAEASQVTEGREASRATAEEPEVIHAPVRKRNRSTTRASRRKAEATDQETPGSEQPTPQPDASQRQALRPSQRKKRRQSKKAAYGEPNYSSRAPSPELGSQPSRASAERAPTPKKALDEQRAYNIPSSDDEQPSQIVLGRTKDKARSASAVANQEKPKTKRKSMTDNRRSSQSGQKTAQPDQQQGRSSRQSSKAAPEPRDEDEEQQEERKEEKEEREQSDDGHGENDVDSSEDEPDVEEEPEASHLADDSLLLDAPPENSQSGILIRTARVPRKPVQDLMYSMTLLGWMNKRRWEKEVLEQAKAGAERLAGDSNCRVLSTIILAKLYNLYKLCKDIPRVSRLEQLAYLREHSIQLSTLISTLHQSIDQFILNINTIIEEGDPAREGIGRQHVTKLHRRIIPTLVLVLDQAFNAGCRQPLGENQRASTQKGDFTVYLLEPLERAAGWTQRLSHVVESWYELHAPRRERDREEKAKEHRDRFNAGTLALKRTLEKAKEDIGRLTMTPRELRKLRERDDAVRKEREFEAQQRRETQDLQMQRFIQSVQKVKVSQPQPRMRSHRQELRNPQPAASHLGLDSSQRPPEEGYFEKHGWHYWEDDQLLSLIRTTSHPNYSVFCQMIPNRDPAELRERSEYLRRVMHDKYERKGISPPGWCID
ncbi:Ff.00g025010.m01.CDS01 [Fusarium sp. VM40]|nr:Ff.00g025010.m01.CDS01 [Fusarium sp. VM40]